MNSRVIESMLDRAIADELFSGARVLVRHRNETEFEIGAGTVRFGEGARKIDRNTLFDLASLTKPLVTTGSVALLMQKNLIGLDDPASKYIHSLKKEKRSRITIRHLLQHASGLPAWKPYYEEICTAENPRESLISAIAREPLIHEPGEKAIYSDLDFILLGRIIEEVSGQRLDLFFHASIAKPLGIEDLFFLPIGEPESAIRKNRFAIAATENCPRRGLLSGEVHDDNAHAAGGVCGHAGLFGSANAVDRLLEEWRSAIKGNGKLFDRDTAVEFVYPHKAIFGSSYALGWDRPTWKSSHAGRYISPHSIGHLGFTGVSAWLDHDRSLSVVLLTNRVHPERDKPGIGEFRRCLHNAVFESLNATSPGPYTAPPDAESIKSIHLIGIAGTGMGSLAGMLKQAGYEVSGSDEAIYPPMSTLLETHGIEVRQPFDPSNLDPPADLSIVGNVCSRDHIEAAEIRRRGLAYDSLPGALERIFLKKRRPLVVAGTHGKTTTCAMAAWLLEAAGLDPGFMIGGLLPNWGGNCKIGSGRHFVVEGDEYDSAYFDKQPKFLHYRPQAAIVTSIEYDHADIYDSVEEIEERFVQFVKLIPQDGLLVACYDYETVRRVAGRAGCRVIGYGEHPDSRARAVDLHIENENTSFRIERDDGPDIELSIPMTGLHNVANATAAALLLSNEGLTVRQIRNGFTEFKGIARRQELKGVVGDVRVIDDFAHHPTALKLTLEGLRMRYPEGRLLAAFDPRTNTTSRNIFQRELIHAFEAADYAVIGAPSRTDRIAPEDRLDPERLARDISNAETEAEHLADIDDICEALTKRARPGDTIAVLSNGGFGGLHEKLLNKLARNDKSK